MTNNDIRNHEPVTIVECAPTPLGNIWLAFSRLGLLLLEIQSNQNRMVKLLNHRKLLHISHNPIYHEAEVQQLKDYFDGKLQIFTIPIDWRLTGNFQKAVLEATMDIPYGTITTYQAIAKKLGRPLAARAVGQAEARNPIPVIIPCHRVIGMDGKLHGYGAPGGIKTKAWLLELEGVKYP